MRLTSRASPEQEFESLYERHVGDVYRYALAVLGNPADAEDVTQTAFLNAYRAIERGERPRKPEHWLRAIAHNLCRQRFRQAARRPVEIPFADDVGELVEEEEGSPSLEDLQRALGHLPFTQRAALVMREFEDRSLKEIARALELSTSAVETLLFRARRSLREQIEASLTCGEAERAISRQLDGRLSRRERGELRAHLRECEQCASLARRLRAQRGAIKSLAVLPLPATLVWSGSSAAGGAVAGAAAAGNAPLAGSLTAKLVAATLAATAVGGVGYEAATHHGLGLGGSRRPPAPRGVDTQSPTANQIVSAAPVGPGNSGLATRARPLRGAAGRSSLRQAHRDLRAPRLGFAPGAAVVADPRAPARHAAPGRKAPGPTDLRATPEPKPAKAEHHGVKGHSPPQPKSAPPAPDPAESPKAKKTPKQGEHGGGKGVKPAPTAPPPSAKASHEQKQPKPPKPAGSAKEKEHPQAPPHEAEPE
jgi:RNA polymerase sigma factor (sigma-70 family)